MSPQPRAVETTADASALEWWCLGDINILFIQPPSYTVYNTLNSGRQLARRGRTLPPRGSSLAREGGVSCPGFKDNHRDPSLPYQTIVM